MNIAVIGSGMTVFGELWETSPRAPRPRAGRPRACARSSDGVSWPPPRFDSTTSIALEGPGRR